MSVVLMLIVIALIGMAIFVTSEINDETYRHR